MKDERSPSLPVAPESFELEGSSAWPDEPPFDAAELALAEETRAALDAGEEPLALALRVALGEAPPFDHDALLARALAGPVDAPAAPAEVDAAATLAAGLASPSRAAEEPRELVLANVLRAAWSPRELPALKNELLVTRALSSAVKKPQRRVFAFVAGALALAASVGLALRVLPSGAPPGAGLATVRSTAELFDPMTPFPLQGGTSERVDRIASARAAELRENRFAAWGVR